MCDQKQKSDQAQKSQLDKLFSRNFEKVWRKDQRAQDPNMRTLTQMVQEILRK